MTIPERAIILLIIVGTTLLTLRGFLASASKRKGRRQARWCVSGASKTIGDREVQEDEYGITETEDGTLAVLADGMGKHFGGKIAARTAVQVFQEIFEDRNAFYNPQYFLRRAFHGANQQILEQLEEVPTRSFRRVRRF